MRASVQPEVSIWDVLAEKEIAQRDAENAKVQMWSAIIEREEAKESARTAEAVAVAASLALVAALTFIIASRRAAIRAWCAAIQWGRVVFCMAIGAVAYSTTSITRTESDSHRWIVGGGSCVVAWFLFPLLARREKP